MAAVAVLFGGVCAIAVAYAVWIIHDVPPDKDYIDWRVGVRRAFAGADAGVWFAVCYAGELAEGKAVLAPLRRLAEPLIDLIEPKPYVAHQGMLDAGVPHGLRYYWKSHYLPALGDADHGFPYLSGRGRLVVKDAIMLGAGLVTMADSAKAWLARTG